MKFAERLAAHITPEWNSQYIKYDVFYVLIMDILNITIYLQLNYLFFL
jgi:hypothetical protein